MESWSYISRGEAFVHHESVSATDRNENWLVDSNAFMSSNQEGTKNSQFVELGYADRMPQIQDKPLIDLKLGRFPDHKDAQGNANNPNFSSAESSSMIPAKRIRAGKSSNQIPYCQVYGCKKDLSNCKEYHKRHKVCEIHSKTAKVIVNGIDQRFCQQCSRFHLLAEFDEGKRSCRRRLAGHNERRRKPHVGMHSSRSGRFFPPYNGTRFNGPSCFAFPSSSVYRDRHPPPSNHLLLTQKHEPNSNDRYTNMAAEHGYVPPPPQHGNISYQMCSSNPETQSSFLVHNISCQDFDDSSSHSLFRNEDLTILTDSNSSSCALSLLSFQSENPPNNNIPSIPSTCHLTQSNVIHEDETQMEEQILISDGGIGSDKYYGINEFLPVENTENRVRNGDGSTINLLQLSSQLQQVKQEEDEDEDTWFGLRIT